MSGATRSERGARSATGDPDSSSIAVPTGGAAPSPAFVDFLVELYDPRHHGSWGRFAADRASFLGLDEGGALDAVRLASLKLQADRRWSNKEPSVEDAVRDFFSEMGRARASGRDPPSADDAPAKWGLKFRIFSRTSPQAFRDVVPPYADRSFPYIVVQRHEGSRKPLVAVGVEAGTGLLAMFTEAATKDGEPSTVTNYILPELVNTAKAFVDEHESRWYELVVSGVPVRGRADEFVPLLVRRFQLGTANRERVAAWLHYLPVAGRVSTTLRLRIGEAEGRRFVGIDPVFGRTFDGTEDTAVQLWHMYHPRSAAEASRRLREFLPFLTTPKHVVIACFIAGAPVVQALAPWRIAPYLDEEGESGAGKTHLTRAALSVLWGTNDGPKELFGGSRIGSSFRADDVASATNLVVLIDEAEVGHELRERLRAKASGTTTARGRRDLTSRSYAGTATFAFARNPTTDSSDSSAAEVHGDARRRIMLQFEHQDVVAITSRQTEFLRFTSTLVGGEEAAEGGGAVIWKLRQMSETDFENLKQAANDPAANDTQAVLNVGAALLGFDAPAVPDEASRDPAGEAFLAWLSTEVARYNVAMEAMGWRRTAVAHADAGPRNIAEAEVLARTATARPERNGPLVVFVSAQTLAAYAAELKRRGRSSPYTSIRDLRSLAPLTGQTADEIALAERGRHHTERLDGRATAVARVVLPGSSEHLEPWEGSRGFPAMPRQRGEF